MAKLYWAKSRGIGQRTAERERGRMSEPAPEQLLTPQGVAERLRLSPITVGHMLRAGTLPGVKVLRLWRVRAADLDEYIRGLTAAPQKTKGAKKRATDGERAEGPS